MMTGMTSPTDARCARCHQLRTVHAPKAEWGKIPGPLCGPCWGQYDEARSTGTYADWGDAFDNDASDEELVTNLSSPEA